MGKVNLKQFLVVVAVLFCGTWAQAQIFQDAELTTTVPDGTSVDFFDTAADVLGTSVDYLDSQNTTTIICANAGFQVTVVFNSFATEANFDELYISGAIVGSPCNDGPTGTLEYTGAILPADATSVDGGCLTFNFTPDVSNVDAGWEAVATSAVAVPVAPFTSVGQHDGSVTLDAGTTIDYTDTCSEPSDYPNGQNTTLEICPAAGEALTVTFTAFGTEACCDDLTFDGNTYAGVALPPVFSGGTDQCVDFDFFSDGSVAAAGWTATAASAPLVDDGICDPPTGLAVLGNLMGTSTDLTWTSDNAPVDDHCWNFYIGNEGFDCEDNEEFIAATVCNIAGTWTSNNPLITVLDINDNTGVVEIHVEGLQPGTVYEFSIFETCDGMPANNGFDCDDATSAPFMTLDDPYVVTGENIVSPDCPQASVGNPVLIMNGSFDIDIVDSPTCAGTYDIVVVPVANSAPDGTTPADVTPTNYVGETDPVSVSFADVEAGEYEVTVTETSGCNPANDPETITVVVPDGTDAVAPTVWLFDLIANNVASTDPLAAAPNFDAGTHNLPEGACNFQEDFFMTGIDGCDGPMTDVTAVTATATTLPSSIDPGTQATVTPNFFGYRINIDWSVGTSTVTIVMEDVAGNQAVVTVTRTIIDNADATIVAAPINALIPVCADSRTINYGFTIVDACDNEIALGAAPVVGNDFAGDFAEGNWTVTEDPADESTVTFTGTTLVLSTHGSSTDASVSIAMPADGMLAFDYDFNGVDLRGDGTGYDILLVDVAGNVIVDTEAAGAETGSINVAVNAGDILTITNDDDGFNPSGANSALASISTITNFSFTTFSSQPVVVSTSFGTVDDVNFYSDGNGYFEYEVTFNGPGTGLFFIEYTDDFGNVFLADVLIDVQNAAVDMPAIIIAADDNVTLPHCEDDIFFCYSFQIIDDCDDIVAADMAFTGGGSGLANPVVIAGPNPKAVFFEVCGVVDPGTYIFTITYQGQQVEPLVIINQEANQAASITMPGNLNWTIPSCDTDLFTTMAIQVCDDCDPVQTSEVVTTGFTGDFAEANWTIATDATDGTAAVTFPDVNTMVLTTFDAGDFDGDDLDLDGINAAASIAIPSNGTIEFDYDFNGIDAGWDWFVITVDGAVRASGDIAANGTFTENFVGGETLLIGIDDDGAAPVGPDATSTLTVNNFSFAVPPAFFSVTLDGVALQPWYTVANGNCTYVEYPVTLTAANNFSSLEASYTDVDGANTTVDAVITVADHPDTWAPIIIYPSQDINVELDPCEASLALVFFEITLTDNCSTFGNGLTGTVSALSSDGVILIASPGGPTVAGFFAPGVHQVLISATDGAGNTRQEDFFVVVTQDAAVPANLACAGAFNFTLNDDCEQEIIPSMVLNGEFGCLTPADFNLTVVDGDTSNGAIIDGCGTFPFVVELATAPATEGFTGPFAPSNWMLTQDPSTGAGDTDWSEIDFTATSMTLSTLGAGPFDGGGFSINGLDAIAAIAMPSEGTITFDYDYNGYDAGWDWFLIDIDGTVIANSSFADAGTVSENVSDGMILMIAIEDDGLLPVGPDLPSIVVIDAFTFQPASNPAAGDFVTCWSELTAEDKTAPVIECPEDTDSANLTEDVQTLQGDLTASDPTLVLNDYSCFQEIFEIGTEDNHYDLFTFTVSQDDIYTFYGIFQGVGFDFTGYLFAGGFDVDSPCSNIVAGSNNGTDGFVINNFGPNVVYWAPAFRVSLPLVAGQTYTMLTSATGQFGTSLTGNYRWDIFSDGNGRVNGLSVTAANVTRPLVCDDYDSVKLDGIHTYETDADGNTIPGTMSSALRTVLDATGHPTISDNCGNILVTVWDEAVANGDCGLQVITRHFEIRDRYNSECTGVPMTDECTQIITVRKATMDEVAMPPLSSISECDEAIPYDANGHPHPSLTGYPFLQTAFGIHNVAEVYCNITANYEDNAPIVVCEGTTKFIREWTITDWCEPGRTIQYLQIIKVGDFTKPVVSCNEQDLDWDGTPDTPRYSVGVYDCTASFGVPMPIVEDNCSSTFEVLTEIYGTIEVPVWDQWNINIIGYTTEEVVIASIGPNDNRFVSGIEKGCYFFKYTVTDACGNIGVEKCPFIVEDAVAPTPSCDDQLNVSISNGGSRIYAAAIGEGSNDNCAGFDVKLEVRRSYPNGSWSPWGPHVDFTCDDVHNFVTIELQVWDDRNMDGIPGNRISVSYCDGTSELVEDNVNMCWMEIQIEDKIAPHCQAPHDQELHCDDDDALHLVQNLGNVDWLNEHFGEAIGTDNCEATAEQTGVINGLNDCGWGTITRRFRATDGWGLTSSNTCRQVIHIYEVHDYEIKFPKDASANCGTPNVDTIETFANACDLFAINVFDDRYDASGDECYKILRRYRVINWCEYNGDDLPIVIGRDEDCDNNPGDEDVYVIVRTTWNGNNPIVKTYLDRDQDETNNNPFTGNNRCGAPAYPHGHWSNSDNNPELYSVGHWEYTQLIKVYDNVAPIVEEDPNRPWDFCSYDNVTCTGDVSIDFTVDENCTPDAVTLVGYIDMFNDGVLDGSATITGSYPNYTISGNYPLGEHRFGVRVDDGCGNQAWLDIVFEVVDCKISAPICISGLAVNLMPVITGGGMMEIWASDFIASPIDDCSGIKGFSIHKTVEVENGTDVPSFPNPAIVLTCDDEATTIVRIYSWDNAYNPYAVQPDGSIGGPNWDYCETFVIVQDWNEACPTTGTRSVAGTIATENDEALEGANVSLTGDMAMDDVTSNEGDYAFTNVTVGSDVTVTPQLDVNPLNGVSTFDLVLISKHILGIQLLDSPYKMIAADVNNSNSVSTIDIIQLRKLILGIYTEFPSNTSWRFVADDYDFIGGNPFAESFPEVVSFNNIAENEIANFIAVKTGDVNASAAANLASVEDRTLNGVFAFNVAEQAVKAGTQVTVDFTAADIANVTGYQATLTFDQSALSLNDIVSNVATEENFGTVFVNEGVITTSWNGEAKNNEVLFSLVFDVKADANLSNLLGVSSRYTRAEAYAAGNTSDVAINFTNGAVAVAGFEVYQNTPNPFKGETVIGFNLPADAQVTLTVQDVTGKTLKVVSRGGVKGYNTVALNSKDLATSGVLYYTVSTDEFTSTKKMVVVK